MLINIAEQNIEVNPLDWNATTQNVKDAIDEGLANLIKKNLIVGQYPIKYCNAEMARLLVPDLSSMNPSIVWNKAQAVSIGYKISNLQEAVDIIEFLCLPPAKEALKGLQIKYEGGTCQWPPSFYAAAWVEWCLKHMESLKKVMGSEYEDRLIGRMAWEAGEIATSWTHFNSPVKEDGNKRIWFDGKVSIGWDSVHGTAV